MKGVAPKPQAPRHPRTPKPPPPRHNGGFCTIRSLLSACRRRVAPLMVQFPRLVAVRSRFGAVRCPHRRLPRRQTPTMGRAVPGVVGEVVCDAGTTAPGRARRSHTNPLLRVLACYFARKPAIPRLGAAAHARISGLACELEGPRARGYASHPSNGSPRGRRGPTCARVRSLGAVSHAIRLSEYSTMSGNIAIPTMRMCGATQGRGNCMRHSEITHPTGVKQCRRQGRGQARREPRWCHNPPCEPRRELSSPV